MSLVLLKEGALRSAKKWAKDLSRVLQDNTDEYSLFRGKLFCNEHGNVCIDFLASDINGNFKKPSLELDTETNTMYLDRTSKFNFADESAVKKAITEFVEGWVSFSQPISQVFFDISPNSDVSRGFVRKDEKEVGSVKIYLEVSQVFEDNYGFTTAVNICGEELTSRWDLES